MRGNVDCDRARRWAALAPDGELTEVEAQALRAHASRCASCSLVAAEMEELAGMLRGLELDRPSQPVSLRIPSRRHSALARTRPIAAVAAVALMALGVANRAPLPMDERSSPLHTSVPAQDEHAEMQALRERRQVTTLNPEDLAVVERPFAV